MAQKRSSRKFTTCNQTHQRKTDLRAIGVEGADVVCSECGNKGHMRRTKDQGRRQLRQVQETDGYESESSQEETLYSVSSRKSNSTPPIIVCLLIVST